MKKVTFLLISLLILLSINILPTFSETDNTIFVSPDGSNSNSGTLQSPFATIQYAIDKAAPGTTVFVKQGTYYERLSFNRSGSRDQGYIKLIPYGSENVTIDGSKLKSNTEANELVSINGKSYIHIEGIEFRNVNFDFARGIYVFNGSSNIIIKNNTFHDINTTKLDIGSFGGASAIIVKSYDEKLLNHDIIIEGNHIYDCILGYSEALVLTGNTKDFKVINNTIKNVTNIGIDIAGHYGDYKGDPSTNQARDGLIDGNIVSGCKSDYGSGAASGIYVDGGRDVVISNNIVTNSDYGITIGCEESGKTSSGVIVTANFVFLNDKSGISVGGYKESVGRVIDCKVTLNRTYKNNLHGLSYQGELNIKASENIEISDNIFYSGQMKASETTKDTRLYPIVYNDLPVKAIELSDNVYFSDAGVADTHFKWQDEDYIGFKVYKTETSNDLSSLFYNPLYRNPEKGDLALTAFKPLIEIDSSNSDWLANVPMYMPPQKLPIFSVVNDARFLYLIYEPTDAIVDISIFIDCDQSSSTGYKTSKWKNVGIDYLIEEGTLYQYSGEGEDWTFTKIQKVVLSESNKASEFKIPLSVIDACSGKTIGIGTISKSKFQLPSKGLPLYPYLLKHSLIR